MCSSDLRNIALLVQPFMPESTGKILDQLVIPADQRSFAFTGSRGQLHAGVQLPKPSGIFPRFVEEEQGAA